MERYRMPTTTYAIWHEFVLKLFIGGLLCFPGLYMLLDGRLFTGTLILLFFFWFFIYRPSDYLFSKVLFQDTDSFRLKMAFWAFKIDKQRCFTVIEPYSFPSSYGSRFFHLALVRNTESRWQRLFKNKIKLYPEDGTIDLEGLAKKIKDEFGIPYHGIFDFSSGGVMDKSALMKHKGLIP